MDFTGSVINQLLAPPQDLRSFSSVPMVPGTVEDTTEQARDVSPRRALRMLAIALGRQSLQSKNPGTVAAMHQPF
jgi:hypothetical protein